ncbi:protein STRUBBELIG-RECEPTOR FAMILY 3-like isoform X2 [Henckelia pumila]
MGFFSEYGQRLLIYEYCTCGTLQDSLHSDDEFKKKLSSNTRIRMALGAARALEYLHEVCEPPVIHRNFKSANVLLDDELSVHVSDCGLAPLISSGAISQIGCSVSIKSLLHSMKVVAKGVVRSMDLNIKVGRQMLGPNWCEIQVLVVLEKEESLIRSYDLLQKFGDALKGMIAWPCHLV